MKKGFAIVLFILITFLSACDNSSYMSADTKEEIVSMLKKNELIINYFKTDKKDSIQINRFEYDKDTKKTNYTVNFKPNRNYRKLNAKEKENVLIAVGQIVHDNSDYDCSNSGICHLDTISVSYQDSNGKMKNEKPNKSNVSEDFKMDFFLLDSYFEEEKRFDSIHIEDDDINSILNE